MVQRLILEFIQVSLTLATLILARWLLLLSTPKEDWNWIKHQDIWYYMRRLKWYRGTEYLHQVKFQRLLKGIE